MTKKKNSKLSPYFNRKMKAKLVVVFIVFFILLFSLNFKLSYINMKSGDSYSIQVLAQQQYSNKTLAFKRGSILDRNNVELATSIKTYNLVLDPKIMLSKEKVYLIPTVQALASCFTLSEEELTTIINNKKDSSYVVHLKQLTFEQIEVFLNLQEEQNNNKDKKDDIQGVWFEEEYERKYPFSTLASDVIGFTTDSETGAVGIEKYYNDYLTGSNGREYGYVNDDNVFEYIVKEAQDGDSLITSIDMNIQSIVEKYILEYKTQYSPKNIAVVIADPNTGEILAMASDKGYDLNNPRDLNSYYTPEEIEAMTDSQVVDNLNAIWNNYCISDSYEPGSTFKPFTIAMSLEEMKISTLDTYNCDGGELVGGWHIDCHLKTGHGILDVKQSLMQSCNDALMQIVTKVGPDIFTNYQSIFGFGTYTGIDLPSEAAGILYKAEDMVDSDLATSSFGQSFTTTMVQMVSGFSSLINGGNYYEPHMVKQIVDQNGKIVKNIDKTLVKQTVSLETSAFIKESLLATVVEGTGKSAAVVGYEVGGKTGTAEKYPRGEGKYLLSFLGFAPYNNPQVVCYVIVDEPQVPDTSSSSYASKLFSLIMTEVLPYMDIYPN